MEKFLEKLATLCTKTLDGNDTRILEKRQHHPNARERRHQGPEKLQADPLLVLSKIFTKIMANKIKATLQFNLPKNQARFRTGYCLIDHIHTISHVIEKCMEYNQPLYMAFIDYEKAFDLIET